MLQAYLITRSFDLFLSLFRSVVLLPPTLTWPGPGLQPSRLVLVELSAPPSTAGSKGTSLITQAKGLVRHLPLYRGFLGAAFSSAQPWLNGVRGSGRILSSQTLTPGHCLCSSIPIQLSQGSLSLFCFGKCTSPPHLFLIKRDLTQKPPPHSLTHLQLLGDPEIHAPEH